MKLQMRKVLAITIFVGVLSTSGCTATATPVAPPKETEAPEVIVKKETFPLTGLEIPDAKTDWKDKPVVIAKMDNSPDARPQEGLNSADIIFEVLVEGGITRFAGVFHSNFPDRVGPIRSVRPMDPDLSSPFGGIIAYSGGQVRFVKKMRATELYNATETSEQSKKTMVRIKSRNAPHNLFLLPAKIQGQHLKMAGPNNWQTFTSEDAEVSTKSGTPVTAATARFPATTVVWSYNGSTGKFERTQDRQKAFDGATKERVATENLVLIYVDIDRSEPDPIYGNVPRTIVNGTGKGFYLHDGLSIPIIWEKKDRKSMHVFTTESGEKIVMAAGNTWVEMVPTDRKGKITLK